MKAQKYFLFLKGKKKKKLTREGKMATPFDLTRVDTERSTDHT